MKKNLLELNTIVIILILSVIIASGCEVADTPTSTARLTATPTPSNTATSAPSATATATAFNTATATAPNTATATAPNTATATATPTSEAIGLMEIAFLGGYDQDQIKTLLDQTMVLYDLEITEDNYMRVGNVLVALRKQTDVPEMDILICAKEAHTPGVNLQIPDAMGICAATLNQ